MTPSSKVVGDLAQFMVQNKLNEEDLLMRGLDYPNSVVEYFLGTLGEPPGGFPPELRKLVSYTLSLVCLFICFFESQN